MRAAQQQQQQQQQKEERKRPIEGGGPADAAQRDAKRPHLDVNGKGS